MRPTEWARCFAAVCLVLAMADVSPGEAANPPSPRLSRVLLISVDGLRPDLLLRARTPVLRGLMERGSFTMWARTTAVSVTLPSHTSMLTGVVPAKHGIEWNTDLPFSRPVYPARATLFQLAHKAGLSTAMAAGKSKLSPLQVPGTLDWSYVPKPGAEASDEAVADTVVRWIMRHEPKVLFVHLPEVDFAGHDWGWGSQAQLSAIATVDSCIGLITGALRTRRLLDSTLIIVTADHGGAGSTHGADDARSRTIPWIVAGPDVCRGLDLTAIAELEVRTEDTFATACFLLGLSPPEPVDGRAVSQILCAPQSGNRPSSRGR